LNSHLPQCVRSPLAMLKKEKGSAISQTGKMWRLRSSPCKDVVRQPNRNDLTNGIREGDFLAHDSRQSQPSHEENEDKLKGSQLLARSSPDDTNDEDEEEVPKERSDDRCHEMPDRGNVREEFTRQTMRRFGTKKGLPIGTGEMQSMSKHT
jgi:hypothetical protein